MSTPAPPATSPAPSSSSSSSGSGGPQVRDLPGIFKGTGRAKRAVGDAPLVPVTLIMIGGYLAWFGIHYWRDQATHWPTDPVKAVLTGKGIPQPVRSQTVAEDIAGAASYAADPNAGTIAAGTTSGDAIAQDAAQYAGRVRYAWGGGSPATGWDCSGLVNWVLCHDLLLDIPGYRAGTFTGKAGEHGPNVASWLATNLVQRTTGQILPGDLIAWGPNEHMGIALSATEMVSAENPRDGTARAPIAGFKAVLPVILRVKAVIQQQGGDAATNQNIAKLLAAAFGWSSAQDGGQWNALVSLWDRESKWSVTATNPNSGAYGIPQALPGSKMAAAGGDWKTSAQTQIAWGLSYIRTRYGTPEAAWAHEQAQGWY